jgi:ornithine decarboxylase
MQNCPTENIFNFISAKDFDRIKTFAKDKRTPFLILDRKKVLRKFDELKKNLPTAKIYFAVKANPNGEILGALARRGSYFDIASVGELDQLLSLGVDPAKISFGNTIKKPADTAFAFAKGVRLFTTDSPNDLKNLAKNAPGARVFFRILTEGSGADWPLSRKFGAHPEMVRRLILRAKKLGLRPFGISFHVGSQQRNIGQWDSAIAQAKYLFDAAAEAGIRLRAINIGGGLPARYIQPAQKIKKYAEEISHFLTTYFGKKIPEIIVEPGRSIVAEAGVLVSEVVLTSEKSLASQYKWLFLDVGKFGGLIETMDEAIKYPIFVEPKKNHKPNREFILAGPTCDSVDILYEEFKYQFPANIKTGERVFIFSTGAYTQSYSSVYFNGFPPLREFVI